MLLDVFATSCPTNLEIYNPAGWNENTTRAFKKRIMHINYVECKSGCLLHRKKECFPLSKEDNGFVVVIYMRELSKC